MQLDAGKLDRAFYNIDENYGRHGEIWGYGIFNKFKYRLSDPVQWCHINTNFYNIVNNNLHKDILIIKARDDLYYCVNSQPSVGWSLHEAKSWQEVLDRP